MESRARGPVEAYPWPHKLTARVVTPGPKPRVHGYSVETDLARNYRFTDTVLLALTGELPSEKDSAAFEVAVQFLSTTTIAEAPAHAGALARLCGATAASVSSSTAICLSEQAGLLLETQRAWLAWLAAPSSEVPSCAFDSTGGDAASVRALRACLAEKGSTLRELGLGITREAALLATLHAVGLRTIEQLLTAVVFARLPIALAEAIRMPPTSFRDYPMRLPDYTYEAPHG